MQNYAIVAERSRPYPSVTCKETLEHLLRVTITNGPTQADI